ncbi:TetR/AcrR family transcriptional regulator [Agrococcus sp. Marseille-P2731]|uniref:TetR/AcrR family transcriptional regulator n=1 Tax=Agrococcus sp. Marseille-P2731 TaxID=1841862 RepID=UPI001F2B862B|nr:TetR/AcrR family transcriptional regulator [Agrococcus sp. Marseille-P2731]
MRSAQDSRAKLTPSAIADAALAEIDAHGLAALTMAAIAERTGVRGPSLYKHVGGLADLKASVAERVLTEITEVLTSAAMGRSGADAVAALMHAYRDYAASHPKRYAAIPSDPLRDARTAEAAQRQLDVILAVLRGCAIGGTDAIHVTRSLRAMVHGFADIESSNGFGLAEEIDESFARMVAGFLSTLPPSPSLTEERDDSPVR